MSRDEQISRGSGGASELKQGKKKKDVTDIASGFLRNCLCRLVDVELAGSLV